MTTKWLKQDEALIIRADTTAVGINEAREYLTEIKKCTDRYAFLIFDFTDVSEITPAALRTLTLAISITSQINAKIAIVGSPTIDRCINDCNLGKVFSCYKSIDQILKNNSPSSLLSKTLAEGLDEAIKSTFQTLTGAETKPVHFDTATQQHQNSFEIGAIVGINDSSFKGSLILGFSVKTYLNLMSKMFGSTFTEITGEINDGPAEVLNMIFGNFKINLNNQGFKVLPAIPTTIMGSNLRIVPSGKAASPTVLVYESEFGPFYVEMTTNYQSQKVAA